jgi:membrane protease YdiL (CAAX protease family)
MSPARLSLARMLGLTVLLTVLSVAMDQYGAPLLERVLPSLRLAFVPWDPTSPLFVPDCFLGLGLVALLEEAIFRGLALSALRGVLGQGPALYLATAVLFGLIHWSLGLPAVVNAAVIGALFMPVMVRHGTVWPQIGAHFLVDFVFFCKCLAVGPCG